MMDRGTIQALKDANDRAEFAEVKLAEALDHIENLVSSIAELERDSAFWRGERDKALEFAQMIGPDISDLHLRLKELIAKCREEGMTLGEVADKLAGAIDLMRVMGKKP